MLVSFFQLGQIAQQLANADIRRLLGSPGVKALGLELHPLGLLADGVERQVTREPDWSAADEALDVFAPDRRKVRSEALLIHLQQQMSMALFLFGHLAEDFRGIGIALCQILGEAEIDPAVLFLAGDRNRQHLAFGEAPKTPSYQCLA